jgi:regulator of sirC expression with transglutaminase-like and TPR domain
MRIASPARQRFLNLIRQPEPQLPLAEAALCIAWEDQRHNILAPALQQLDSMADRVRPRLAGIARPDEPQRVVDVLNTFLFDEMGFRGNTQDYDNPNNSFLDQVLATRSGLPITLSIVYMTIGWRLGLPIAGVALPGHFLARYASSEDELFIDPFNQGRLWSREECVQQVQRIYHNAPATLVAEIMQPPSRKAILVRILRNLKHAYMQRDAFAQSLAAVERILLLLPGDAAEVRDRGLIYSRLGQHHRALEDLEYYASQTPTAPDLPQIQSFARSLAENMTSGN